MGEASALHNGTYRPHMDVTNRRNWQMRETLGNRILYLRFGCPGRQTPKHSLVFGIFIRKEEKEESGRGRSQAVMPAWQLQPVLRGALELKCLLRVIPQ